MHLHIIGASVAAATLYLVFTLGSSPQNNLGTSIAQIEKFFGASGNNASSSGLGQSNVGSLINTSGLQNNVFVQSLADDADVALDKLSNLSIFNNDLIDRAGIASSMANIKNSVSTNIKHQVVKQQAKNNIEDKSYATGAYRYTKKSEPGLISSEGNANNIRQNSNDEFANVSSRLKNQDFKIEQF